MWEGRPSHEAKGKAETAGARQQGEKAEAELSEADQAATERGKKEGSTERSVRRRTDEGELVEPAPPAAGGTSAAAAGDIQQVRQIKQIKRQPSAARRRGPPRGL